MGTSPNLWFCACKTATLGPDQQVCMGPRPLLWICVHITECLALELQNDRSIRVPALTCGFVHAKQRL